jgi:hypothetical protein
MMAVGLLKAVWAILFALGPLGPYVPQFISLRKQKLLNPSQYLPTSLGHGSLNDVAPAPREPPHTRKRLSLDKVAAEHKITPSQTLEILAPQQQGFSPNVSLVLLVANALRIAFWFPKRFAKALLAQSVVMIVMQLLMMHAVVAVKVKATRRAGLRLKLEPIADFWNWDSYRYYVGFVGLLSAVVAALYMLLRNSEVRACAEAVQLRIALLPLRQSQTQQLLAAPTTIVVTDCLLRQ